MHKKTSAIFHGWGASVIFFKTANLKIQIQIRENNFRDVKAKKKSNLSFQDIISVKYSSNFVNRDDHNKHYYRCSLRSSSKESAQACWRFGKLTDWDGDERVEYDFAKFRQQKSRSGNSLYTEWLISFFRLWEHFHRLLFCLIFSKLKFQLMLDFNFLPIEWTIIVLYQFAWLCDIKS